MDGEDNENSVLLCQIKVMCAMDGGGTNKNNYNHYPSSSSGNKTSSTMFAQPIARKSLPPSI
jgi:hypothetical protein